MKANWIAGGLLLVLYLLWLTATAPARLLAPCCRPAYRWAVGGSVWRGAAQPVYWHGERRTTGVVADPAGWQVSQRSRGVMGQARLWGLRDLRLQEGGSPPRQPAQPLVDVDYARQGRGEVTFSLTEGRFSDGRCRHHRRRRSGGRPDCTLRSAAGAGPVWHLPLYGGRRRGADSPSGLSSAEPQRPGLCRPMAAICSRHATAPAGCRRCWRCWSRARQRITPGPDAVAAAGKWLPQEQNDDTAALSLHFPCLVWLSTAVRPALGSTMW